MVLGGIGKVTNRSGQSWEMRAGDRHLCVERDAVLTPTPLFDAEEVSFRVGVRVRVWVREGKG